MLKKQGKIFCVERKIKLNNMNPVYNVLAVLCT